MTTASNYYETLPADYSRIPVGFEWVVCQGAYCPGKTRQTGFTNPFVNWVPGYREEELKAKYPLAFEWWVCSACLKVPRLNALNARLIRECENCEQPYLIKTWPDLMNLCEGCNG